MVACADSEFAARPGRPNRFGQYDTGAASMAICLQASAMGLMAHQMAGVDAERLRATFAIPDRYAVMAMIAVGAPVESSEVIRDVIRERELAPRTRGALGEHFFAGKWDRGLV
jgi:nitroreductase